MEILYTHVGGNDVHKKQVTVTARNPDPQRVEARWQTSWCLDVNYFIALNTNLNVNKASQVPRWRESEVFAPLEREVLEYAEAMTTTPQRVTDELSVVLITDDPFVVHRGLLLTVAYQMLGSAADAEDVVQESWLRWAEVDHSGWASQGHTSSGLWRGKPSTLRGHCLVAVRTTSVSGCRSRCRQAPMSPMTSNSRKASQWRC